MALKHPTSWLGYPVWECEDCGKEITHTNNQMLLLKEDIFLSIAEKHESPCSECMSKRLGRKIEMDDLWRNKEGVISFFNNWYIAELSVG